MSIISLKETYDVDEKYLARYEKLLNIPITNSEYTERHHIFPKSIGGKEHPSNLKRIDGRVHFLCHYCLWKMFSRGTPERKKMAYAFNQMRRQRENSRLYLSLKQEHSTNVSADKKANTNVKGYKTYYHPETHKISRARIIPIGMIPGIPESTRKKFAEHKKITDGTNEKWIFPEESIPEGWRLGRCDAFKKQIAEKSKGNKSSLGMKFTRSLETRKKLSESKKGIPSFNSGMYHFHDPVTGKRVYAKECPSGYVPGWKRNQSHIDQSPSLVARTTASFD